jgi:cytochrome c553
VHLLALLLILPMPLGGVDFQRDVQGVLAANCLPCHGRDGSTRQADLRLDQREFALLDRRSGAAIVPGDPDASRLMARITMANPDDRMPPIGHAPLHPDEIEVLRQWIAQGATWSPHWAWQPLQLTATLPDLPEAMAAWPLDPLDTFIAAKLSDAGLTPSPPADSRTWLRRLTFDLTGLPPDPELLDAFAADDTTEARSVIIETLLASPAFGEQWARHWLDAFSYAETCGHEFDYPLAGAWQFRDWLVQSLNTNVPWRRLVQELVAGDLLEPRINPMTGLNDAPLGTGFWCMHQAVHAPVDVLRNEDDHRSDQLDALGRGLLGVTISCARCHDHKFDPISARDYQGLANMLRSSRRVLAGRDQNAAVSKHIAHARVARAATSNEVQRLKAWITAAGAMGAGRPRPGNAPKPLLPPTQTVHADFEHGTDWSFNGHAFALAPAGTWFPTTSGPRLTHRGELHSGLLGDSLWGTANSPKFNIDAANVHWRVRGKGTLRVIVADYIMDRFNALLFEGHLQDIDSDQWTTISHDVAKYIGQRAYLVAIDNGAGTLEIDAVSFADNAPWSQPVEDLDARGTPRLDWRLATTVDEGGQSGCNTLLEHTTSITAPTSTLQLMEGSVVEQPVYIRGEPAQLGIPAPRVVPALFGGDANPATTESGRLHLANAITSPTQPMLWRTATNRIWHHLIGQGFTPLLDDMGAMGTPPSHAALLDHLCIVLADGGTVKDLIRRIVSSATYAQASGRNEEAESIDPSNALVHRMNVRRLTGEQVRDAMLWASGELNTDVGGPPVPIHLTEAMTGRGRPSTSGPLDGNNRRSLYLEVRRNFAIPMLEAFDRPTPNQPCGKRTVSSVPAQSLTMMNDPFVLQQAAALAKRVRAKHASTDAAVQYMAKLVWSQPIDANMLDALRPADTDERWTDLAHAMLCAKAFIFLP